MRTDSVFVLLAPGFEEVGVGVAVRTLRRANRRVEVVGLIAGPIRGASGISVLPDAALTRVDGDIPQAVVLPDGRPAMLSADPRVHALLQRVVGAQTGRYVVALGQACEVLYHAALINRRLSHTDPVPSRVRVEGSLVWTLDPEKVQETMWALIALLEESRQSDRADLLARQETTLEV